LKIDIDAGNIRTATVPSTQVLPPGIQFGNKSDFRHLVRKIRPSLESLSRPVRIFEVNESVIVGKEKYSGQPIRLLYLGETEEAPALRLGKIYSKSEAAGKYSNYQFVLDSIYSDYDIVAQEKNVSAFNIRKRIKRRGKEVDLVVADVESFFLRDIKESPFLVLPQWVWQRLTLADKWDTIVRNFSKNLRKELRRILKRGYQYAVSGSESHFRQFYYEMYLPYTNRRFGKLASPNRSKEIQQSFSGDSEIHFLLQNEEILVGVLQKYHRNRMISVISAAADNLTPRMINGAFTAMDYFGIMTAFEKGCQVIDFMGSRPLLKDGPFRYKRKWGAAIVDGPLPVNDFYFKICHFNGAVRNFFSNNPIITKRGDQYVGKVLLTQQATRDDIEYCLKNYTTCGLSHIEIFCLAGIDNDARETAHVNALRIKLHDISNSDFPEKDFCD
jgi:hypothetical protein